MTIPKIIASCQLVLGHNEHEELIGVKLNGWSVLRPDLLGHSTILQVEGAVHCAVHICARDLLLLCHTVTQNYC